MQSPLRETLPGRRIFPSRVPFGRLCPGRRIFPSRVSRRGLCVIDYWLLLETPQVIHRVLNTCLIRL